MSSAAPDRRSHGETGEGPRLAGLRPTLALRHRVLQAIRQFFTSRDYLEVETPVLLPTPALELHIDAVAAGNGYLRTSPEFHMKRLLAAGYERLFQVGPCFRGGERGDRHHPEYTMLEWYRVGADYRSLLEETRDLLLHVGGQAVGSTRVRYLGTSLDLSAPWWIRTVSEVFREWAGWDPRDRFAADRFDLDLVEIVEPQLPRDRAAVLIDYPIEAGAFARSSPVDARVAERWELYLGGLEIANTYSELTDPAGYRARLETIANERRRLGKDLYAVDRRFLEALQPSLPACAGSALGVDRLVMVLAGAESLDDVLPFREEPGG